MKKTNSNRCSKLVLVCLLVLSAVVAPAAAVSVEKKDVPQSAKVGSQVTSSITLHDLYKNPQLESWTLEGHTELNDVTWTVRYYDQTGSKVSQKSFDGQNMSADLNAKNGVSEVQVEVTGTVPTISNYSYDPAQQFELMKLTQARNGGSSDVVVTKKVHHYTQASKGAEQNLTAAQSAVGGSGKGKDTFDSAVSAYDHGNFENANSLANRAAKEANSAQQSQKTIHLALYGVGGIVVLLVLVGGFVWYRSQQDSYDKLG